MDEFQPYHQEAEEAFVGAFFLDGELINECTVRPEQLYSKKLRLIYSAIRSLNEKAKPIDVISLVDELGLDNLERIGGIHYIVQLTGSVPTIANFHFYEKMVKEYDQKRKAIQIAGKIIENASQEDINKAVSDGIHDLMAIEEDQVDDVFLLYKKIVKELLTNASNLNCLSSS